MCGTTPCVTHLLLHYTTCYECCRAGVGSLTIVDGDVVDVSNINRQLHALGPNIGLPKAAVMAERLRQINPGMHINAKEVGGAMSELVWQCLCAWVCT